MLIYIMLSGANPIPFHVTNCRGVDCVIIISPGKAAVAAIEVCPEDAADLLETEKYCGHCLRVPLKDCRNDTAVKKIPRAIYMMILCLSSLMQQNYPELHNDIGFGFPDINMGRLMIYTTTWAKIFLSGGKKWKNEEKTIKYAFDTARKYHDAILKYFGVSKYKLPKTYGPVMKTFLIGQKASANWMRMKHTQLVFGLYEQLCNGAVESGTFVGIFVWAFMNSVEYYGGNNQCEFFVAMAFAMVAGGYLEDIAWGST
jgi:hypothetical protein